MKEMFEEYGGTVVAVLVGVALLSFLLAIFIPGSPVRKVILEFLTATMPFSFKG
ncbi:MAG: hypothetical protein E6686_04025 [Lachnospiraceae bacterium]|nr:hypothetical protein [Lachnospiraceae bacterium]